MSRFGVSARSALLNPVLNPLVGRQGRLGRKIVVPNLPVWSSALTRVANGLGDAVWLSIGDSRTQGQGAGNPLNDPNNTDARKRSMSGQIAAMFPAKGIPTDATAIIGGGNNAAGIMSAYTSGIITLGAGWTATGGQRLGANSFV